MSEYVSKYDMLYDLKPDDFARMNIEAHPGGGTETLEVPSGEGLVEDQYEAHLRGMEVAYKEPLARILAGLANDLEESGLSKVASQIDETLEQFVVEAQGAQGEWLEVDIEKIKKDIADRTTMLEDIIGRADFHPVAEKILGADQEMLGWVYNIRSFLFQDPVPWDRIINQAQHMLSEKLLYGKLNQYGEVDLEEALSENDFEDYQEHLNKIINDAEIAKRELRDIKIQRRRQKQVEQEDKTPDLDPTTRRRLQQLQIAAKKLAELIRKIDSLAVEYDRSLPDPNLKENMEIKLREIYNKYGAPLSKFLRIKDIIDKSQALPIEVVNNYLRIINNAELAGERIYSEMQQVYKDLTTPPKPGTMVP